MPLIEVKSRNDNNISKVKNNSEAKTMRIFFILMHILFCVDFGFLKLNSAYHRLLVKLLTVAHSIFVNLMCLLVFSGESNIFESASMWYLTYLVENTSYVIILLLIPQNSTFYSFLQNLASIDFKLGVHPSKKLCYKIIFSCLAAFVIKVILSAIYCLINEECTKLNSWLELFSFISYLSNDLPFIVMFFTFRQAHSRLVVFRKCIQNKTVELKEIHRLYKSLLNLTTTVKKSFDPIVSVNYVQY